MHKKSLLPLARRLHRDQTSTEEKLWRCLRGRRLEGLKFRRQQIIAGYIADFCCIEARLTIEIDGKQHDEREYYDRARTAAIAQAGFAELRFSNDEVNERIDWVLQEIRRMVDVSKGREPREAHLRWG